MKTIRIIIIFLLAVFFSMIIYGKCFAATVEAESCSLAHVQAAHDAADRGDTVTVPAGSCTWSSYLSITKSITLQGAGAGSTNIKGNIAVASDPVMAINTSWMIRVVPSSIADDTNVLMRITGFTLDGDSKNNAIYIYNSSTTTDLNKVMIDNNTFTNCRTYKDTTHSATADKTIFIHGNIYGVVHSNTFSGWVGLGTYGNRYATGGATSFINEAFSFGSANAMYWEDNTITYTGTDPDQIFGGSWGGAYVIRYNTISITQNVYKSVTDFHGNQPSGTLYGVRGAELYGNKIDRASGNTGYTRLSDMAGGRHMEFYNHISNAGGGAGIQVRETYIDHVTGSACPSGTLYSGNYCSTAGQPQHVWTTYIWNNRYNTTSLMGVRRSTGSSPAKALRENTDYWKDNSNCTGSSCTTGVGCGTTLPTSCTTGTGYWKTSQSCANTTNMVGTSPATPIAGTLYRCGPTNVWSVYYVPLAYPHALRANDPVPPVDTEAPVISNFSPIVKMKCNDTSAPYTEDVAISIRATDYDQANVVCKWDTSVDADPTYAELSNTFTVSGETFSDTVTANCAAITSIYYACTDGTNTTSVTSTNIEVGDYGDTSEAVITNVGMTNQACAVTQLLIVNTDKQSTCKWDTSDKAYADMANTFTRTVDTTHHEVSVTQNCSASVTRYVRCSTVQGVANSSSTAITITTDAAKAITAGSGSLSITQGSGSLSVTILP